MSSSPIQLPCSHEGEVVRAISGASDEDWVLEHIAGCPRCRELAEELLDTTSLRSTLKSIEEGLEPPDKRNPPGYEILRELRRGGQGIVHEAIQRGTQRRVALKVLPQLPSQNARARMDRELDLLRRLEHPGLVRLYDSGESADGRWLAMEFVDGVHLDQWLASESDLAKRILVIEGIARALHAAHARGVLHRDLKPSNVLVNQRGRPVLLDFGMGKAHSEDRFLTPDLTTSGEFAGTVAYAPPEHVASGTTRDEDARSDVYSLALLAYMAATGRHPFESCKGLGPLVAAIASGDFESPRSASSDVDVGLERVLLKGLATDTADRYQSADAFARDLERWRSGEPVDAGGSRPFEHVRHVARKHSGAILIAAAGILVAGIALGLGIELVRDSRRIEEERADLAALVLARELLAEEPTLWPGEALTNEAADSWSRRAGSLIDQRDALSERLPTDGAAAKDVSDEILAQVVDAVDKLIALAPRVEQRRSRVAVVEATHEELELWIQVDAWISQKTLGDGSSARHPHLRPLPRSDSNAPWEAWHPLSGERPAWDERRARWKITPETGLIFVLSAPMPSPGGLGLKGRDAVWESKYPVTRAQWARLRGDAFDDVEDALFPATEIPASESLRVLRRAALDAPTLKGMLPIFERSIERQRERSAWRATTPRPLEVQRLRPDESGVHGRHRAQWSELIVQRDPLSLELPRYLGPLSLTDSTPLGVAQWIRPVIRTR